MSAKIATALHQVMSAVGYVQKTGKNQFHGYRYAGEADLLDKLRPAMVEAGLLLIPSGRLVSAPDAHGNVAVEVEYTLLHKDGDVWPEKIVAFGCGNDMSPKTGRVGDKGLYKALTGANKYLLFKLFQIETGDDPEADAPAEKSVAQKATPTQPRDDTPFDDAQSPEDGLIDQLNAIKTMKELRGLAVSESWKKAVGALSQGAQARVRSAYGIAQREIGDLELAGAP